MECVGRERLLVDLRPPPHVLYSCALKDLQFEVVEREDSRITLLMNGFEYKKHKIFTEYEQ